MFRLSRRTLNSLQHNFKPIRPFIPQPPKEGDQFDPETWKIEEKPTEDSSPIVETLSEKATVFERADQAAEIKSLGVAPIKSALTLLLNRLQARSLHQKVLSSLRVTLFDFHSTKFAERLIDRNIKEVVIVETDHKNSYAAKDFAHSEQQKDYRKSITVTAYRATLQTLLGVGRQKTAKLPRKLLGKKIQAKPFVLTVPSDTESGDVNGIGPILISAIGTSTQQSANISALQNHLLLHHTHKDDDTIYNYGATEYWTFLDASLLSQLLCSQHDRFDFMSHSNRRKSAVFNKLFNIRLLRDTGFDRKTFHPVFPKPSKSIPYEKKLAELGIHNGLLYAVAIRPNDSILLGDAYLDQVDATGKGLDRGSLLTYVYWMQLVGRQSLSKRISTVLTSLCPESATIASSHADGSAKVGELPQPTIEKMMFAARDEIEHSEAYKKFVDSIKVKRVD